MERTTATANAPTCHFHLPPLHTTGPPNVFSNLEDQSIEKNLTSQSIYTQQRNLFFVPTERKLFPVTPT
jgi:hypothetical protein